MKNQLWDSYEEWLAVVYHGKAMPPDQADAIEFAFFAGALSGWSDAHQYGDDVVIKAIKEYFVRKRAEPANKWS